MVEEAKQYLCETQWSQKQKHLMGMTGHDILVNLASDNYALQSYLRIFHAMQIFSGDVCLHKTQHGWFETEHEQELRVLKG